MSAREIRTFVALEKHLATLRTSTDGVAVKKARRGIARQFKRLVVTLNKHLATIKTSTDEVTVKKAERSMDALIKEGNRLMREDLQCREANRQKSGVA